MGCLRAVGPSNSDFFVSVQHFVSWKPNPLSRTLKGRYRFLGFLLLVLFFLTIDFFVDAFFPVALFFLIFDFRACALD